MTDAEIKELEAKRRKREDELLLLLLLLFGWSVKQAIAAGAGGISGREGTDDGRPVALRIVTQALKEHGVREIAESMADAHLDAYQIYDPSLSLADAPDRDELAKDYASVATDMTDAMVQTLAKHLATTDDLATALLAARYSKSNSRGVELGAERNIVTASNAGLFNGAVMHHGIGGITGLRHRSVVDDRTTKICQEREGLQLPASDPYWRKNWPSLHGACRSVIEILTTALRHSDWRPTVPPDVGYGRMPATVLKMLKMLKAA